MENNNALTYKGTTPRDTERTVDEQWTVERLLAMDVKSRIVSMGRGTTDGRAARDNYNTMNHVVEERYQA